MREGNDLRDFSTRITILSAKMIEEIYGVPKFSEEERELYFAMDPKEQDITYSHSSPSSQLSFILQLGYFKAKKLFFTPTDDEIKEDVQFIGNRYLPGESFPVNPEISRGTWWNQQKRILQLCQYHDCDTSWRERIQEKARQSVRLSSKPIFIFRDLLAYLEKWRVVLPPYSAMQKIVSKAILEERSRLAALAEEHITVHTSKTLQELITTEESSYPLTTIKKEPRDFKHKQISKELARRETLRPLYEFAKDFLPRLNISHDNIKYYASLVDYYSVFRIRRLYKRVANVYLLCFVYHRFQRINDNLVNAFIYHVRKFGNSARLIARSDVYELKIQGNLQLEKAGKVLNLFVDDRIPDETTFGEVKKRAFNILEKDKFTLVVRYISKAEFDPTGIEWNAVESMARTFKKNLRPLLISLDFQSMRKKDSLIEAVAFLKENICNKRSLATIKTDLFPQTFIGSRLRRYIIQKNKSKLGRGVTVRPDRYEFLVYSLLRQYLESGDIYIRDSVRFRSFEDDLIDDDRWRDKEQLIQELDRPLLSKPIEETLAELKAELETLLVKVNHRIREGENDGVKLAKRGRNISWSLPYKKPEDTTNHLLYEQIPQIEITDLLAFVNAECGFMSAFTHILNRYVKNEAENDAIAGAVVALATNKGLLKTAESSDLTYQSLFSATRNYLRMETLRNANDKISNALFRLPIFQYFNIEEDIIHSSSDGQKFENQISTVNARYSPKYFGLKKGVTAYTLVANNVPVNAKIIGANEHESHYVFDILHNNTSDIQPDRHSVDTHGTNNVNFLILSAFGYDFAPRYRDISDKTETIYGFNNLGHYEGFMLKPLKKVKETLIITEWPNIQRILVSLGLKNTTQSIIIGKLSSYVRKNRTKTAMWELDSIYRSIYLLKYVDDVLLRQNVQKALNRGEDYHQLRRAISHEHSGKFRVDTEQEQQVWSECSRLVANAIIFYNAYLLSKMLTQLEKAKQFDLAELIKKVSPIARRHVNLGGRFEFTARKKMPDIDTLLTRLNDYLAKSTS